MRNISGGVLLSGSTLLKYSPSSVACSNLLIVGIISVLPTSQNFCKTLFNYKVQCKVNRNVAYEYCCFQPAFLFFGCVGSSLLHVGFSLVAVSGGYSSLRCAGFSLQWLLLLRSTGSRRTGFSSCGSRALERRLSNCDTRA